MQQNEYIAANRLAWNEVAPIHARQKFAQLLINFQQSGYSSLDAVETALLEQIGLDGKSVAQLCCNNGQELISIKNLGAGRCVGFDISDEFIAQAHQLNSAAQLDCEFVQGDVYNISDSYHGQFDLVFISIGALGWLPDLPRVFQIVARLLRPEGRLLIYEMHPILDMFEGSDQTDPPPLHHSYFRTEPYVDDMGLDYYGNTSYQAAPSYWFHHKLSDIFEGCLQNGLQIKAFREYDHDISEVFAHFAKLTIKPPLTYILLAQLTG